MTDSPQSSARHAAAPTGFERRGRTPVPALDAELTQFVHQPTGARHLHLELPAEDCAFLMGFLTPAPDSSGLTHVLEHLVMCGSERYPCRRAFFAMLGRTLSTAMNALTTEDCTAYHFATRSLPDFENLLSVYLDAAFFPRLDRLDFDQEGCRVEIEPSGGEREAPVRRGVVLSEMRGLMNEPEQQLQQAVNRCLFPSTAYRFNAGGDPWVIPALDHDALVAYHRRHYHPGNALFLSAGPLRPGLAAGAIAGTRAHTVLASRAAFLDTFPIDRGASARIAGQVRRALPHGVRAGARLGRYERGARVASRRNVRSDGRGPRPASRTLSAGARRCAASPGLARSSGDWGGRCSHRTRCRPPAAGWSSSAACTGTIRTRAGPSSRGCSRPSAASLATGSTNPWWTVPLRRWSASCANGTIPAIRSHSISSPGCFPPPCTGVIRPAHSTRRLRSRRCATRPDPARMSRSWSVAVSRTTRNECR